VHVAEVSNFLAAHLRYRNPHLSGRIRIATTQKSPWSPSAWARDVPRSRQEVADYLRAFARNCCATSAAAKCCACCSTPRPQPMAKPFGA
jgi:uncharacterized protein (DUF2236 family)